MSAAVPLAAAVALDATLGEPPARWHPVVAMGRAVAALERTSPRGPRAARAYGVLLPLVPAIGSALTSALIGRVGPAPLRLLATAWLLKSAFAFRALLEAGRQVQDALEAADLPAARRDLRALVSRPTETLGADAAASAAIESLAENLCDSYIAPLMWYRIGGLPAALAYRAFNTADAMVGYRGRYEQLGKAAARLDDAVNYVPARVTAVVLALAATGAGASLRDAIRVSFAQHRRTASPNAGWPMAAAAGALGVRLWKVDHYTLGDGRAPVPRDIQRARRLVAFAAAVFTAALVVSYWKER